MVDDPATDDLPQRSRMAASSTFTYSIESDWAVEWLDSLPYYNDLDDYREVSGGRHVAWMRPETGALEWTPKDSLDSARMYHDGEAYVLDEWPLPLADDWDADALSRHEAAALLEDGFRIRPVGVS